MSSRFGTRTYGKPTKVCQASIQFEKVFTDKNNRPSAAKSTGILHKWGKTSFTSIRNNHLNGQKPPVEEPVKRPKLALDEDPFSFEPEADANHAGTKVVSKLTLAVDKPALPIRAKPNKFFKSGNRGSNVGNRTVAPSRCLTEPRYPPTSSSHLSEISFDTLNIQLTRKTDLLTPALTQTTLDPLIKRSVSPKAFGGTSSPFVTNSERDLLDSISPPPDENDPFAQGLSSSVDSVKKISSPLVGGDCLAINRNEQFFRTYSSFGSAVELPSNVVVSPLVSSEGDNGFVSKDSSLLNDFNEGNGASPTPESDSSNHSIFPKSDICTPDTVDSSEPVLTLDQSNFDITPESSDVSNHSKVDSDLVVSNDATTSNHDTLSLKEASPYVVTAAEQQDAALSLDDEKASSSNEGCTTAMLSEKESAPIPKKEVLPVRTRRIFNSPKKIDKKALYKHRPWQVDDEAIESKEVAAAETKSLVDEFEDEEAVIAPLTRVVTWPTRVGDEAITSVKCSRKAKNYYTVVRNVKKAHQCHESGETQEFNDDIEYLLDGLQSTIPTSTRCLSVLSLAAKCMVPAFRMHLRAHGTISKVFSALSDAPSDQNMSLCTATVMFILSQDRLNMDLERSSLELMLQLLESDFEHCSQPDFDKTPLATDDKSKRELDWSKNKVHELCEEVQKKGHARHLNLDNITADTLAMETLLSLTSSRAGEWFKEELRNLGGLDHLVDTINDCVSCLGQDLDDLSDLKLEGVSKIDRCLRVLESVTLMNSENQIYLITYKDCKLVTSIARVLRLCASALVRLTVFDMSDKESQGYMVFSCMQSVLKVLLNITNNNTLGSSRVGEQEGFIDVALKCIFHIPKIIPPHQIFDLHVLTLGLVINLVEKCSTNCQRLINVHIPPSNDDVECIPSVSLLVSLYLEKEEQARQEEAKTNSLLDGEEEQDEDKEAEPTAQTAQDELENTLTKALQKAGKHMEASIVAAYIAILLGCIVQEKKDQAMEIKLQLPGNEFSTMVQILQRFLNFMNLTGTVGNSALKSIQRVIDVLGSS